MAFFAKGQCCPICSQSFLANSAKYHIKACARQTLAQLDTCSSCGRLVRKEDLKEHAARCRARGAEAASEGSEGLRKTWQEKGKVLRVTLAKIEAGEIGSLDPRGFFLCSICGQQGLGLTEVLSHEEACRQRLSTDGHVSRPDAMTSVDASAGEDGGLPVSLAQAFADLKQEILKVAADEAESSCLLALSIDRLRDVARNACFLEEKKYRRLRLSNPAVAEAIGRWQSSIRMLEAVGFESVMHTSKTGTDPEPHLMLPCQLAESTLQVFLDILDGKQVAQPDTAASTTSAVLEECCYCHRKFRFDRIAKHETRCPESKPRTAKFDAARKLLGGTPGEHHIPDVRELLGRREGGLGSTKLPPLVMKHHNGDGTGAFTDLHECNRCKRRFSAEALEKHAKRCNAPLARTSEVDRPHVRPLGAESEAARRSTPRASRPSSASSAASRSRDPKLPRDGRDSNPKPRPEAKPERTSTPSRAERTSTPSRAERTSTPSRAERTSTPSRATRADRPTSSRATPSLPSLSRAEPREPREAHAEPVKASSAYPLPAPSAKQDFQGQPSYDQLEIDVADWLDT
ncbi:unnamed protein product [Effrenium voratum]|uniref:Uncharacterized protein n=1 Tax=Effrenium voratum TaxID=2562239 RepID=A0AA36J8X5_9DINO|nr:unnamed protein product [Effrenium voratum]CAJ1459058.1 unnamed protein product [Effrenium voratum]